MTATNVTGSFVGKVAFVTGAASRIGRGRRHLRSGQLETARRIEELGGQALAVRVT